MPWNGSHMSLDFEIAGRKIGPGHPTYIIAEMSANHGQDFAEAEKLVHVAKEAGADAVKLQTYTADTITLNARNEYFMIGKGTIWEGKNLHDLYQEAFTPWEWQPKLKKLAESLGMQCFSSPFDPTSVDFLEEMGVDAYKIASFELVDIPLIKKVASTGKPMIMSTGMATLAEIDEAVRVAREAGATQLALLKCNSGYPAPPEEMNLRVIPHLSQAFNVPVGLSDHTLGMAASIASVALGGCIIEKHFILSRETPGPDSAFSLEPHEFKQMVETVRETEKTLGRVQYQPTAKEIASRVFRKSLFIAEDVAEGEIFTAKNVRAVRPSHGLHTRHLDEILGKRATRNIEMGTPVAWDMIRD